MGPRFRGDDVTDYGLLRFARNDGSVASLLAMTVFDPTPLAGTTRGGECMVEKSSS